MDIKTSHSIGNRDNVFKHGNKLIVYFQSFITTDLKELIKYDAILLDARNSDIASIMIKQIRSFALGDLYLKPVFLINYNDEKDCYLKALNDGSISSLENTASLLDKISQIETRISHLEVHNGGSYEEQIFKRVLNYLYSRELNSLKPIADPKSTLGWTYPVVSVNYESFEEARVFDLFEWAERENLIWPDFHDRVYLCSSCSSGHLSFREICPNCDSANMRSEDLVHHFPCGFIGPISDFKNKVDSALACPKCSKNLRHIGVDYDKPSIINHCQNCNEIFQDYIVKAKCFTCSNDADVQYLLSKNINTYKLTKKGRNAAVTGIASAQYLLEENVHGTVASTAFGVMMHYEQERLKANAALNAYIGVIYLQNILDLFRIIGKSKEQEFMAEVVGIIRSNIAATDFISINNPSVIAICLHDTSDERVQFELSKACDKMEELVFDNFGKFQLNTHLHAEFLEKNGSYEKQFVNITKQITEKHD